MNGLFFSSNQKTLNKFANEHVTIGSQSQAILENTGPLWKETDILLYNETRSGWTSWKNLQDTKITFVLFYKDVNGMHIGRRNIILKIQEFQIMNTTMDHIQFQKLWICWV